MILVPAALAGEVLIDGDAIETAERLVSFNGLDAPETRQFCGDA